jgi:crossover junction endodeoxyribonuclease RuvC
MKFIGIDPGLDGAVAILPDGILIDTPTLTIQGKGKSKKRELNVHEMAGILRVAVRDLDLSYLTAQAALEKVHAMPGQGVTSMFSMGKGLGVWLGLLAAFSIPTEVPTPQHWKKLMLDGMGKGKDASRLRAILLFPHLSDKLSQKKDHGRADALLLAEYARRTFS